MEVAGEGEVFLLIFQFKLKPIEKYKAKTRSRVWYLERARVYFNRTSLQDQRERNMSDGGG